MKIENFTSKIAKLTKKKKMKCKLFAKFSTNRTPKYQTSNNISEVKLKVKSNFMQFVAAFLSSRFFNTHRVRSSTNNSGTKNPAKMKKIEKKKLPATGHARENLCEDLDSKTFTQPPA